MTTTDYSLLAASAATILTVAAYWWRRASETARIYVTELGWYFGSLCAAMYAWLVLTEERPFSVSTTGLFALCAVWIGTSCCRSSCEGRRPARRPRRSAARMNPGTEGRTCTRWLHAPAPPGISRRAELDEPRGCATGALPRHAGNSAAAASAVDGQHRRWPGARHAWQQTIQHEETLVMDVKDIDLQRVLHIYNVETLYAAVVEGYVEWRTALVEAVVRAELSGAATMHPDGHELCVRRLFASARN